MKSHILYRKIHHWGAIVVALPLLVMIGAGILLMVKKEFDWIQPPTQKGIERSAVPARSFDDMFAAVKAVPEMGVERWTDLQRVDVKPGKGVVKFVSATNWEVQIDSQTAEVLYLARRRSDIIEAIHDGSWFADWAKLGLFLPAGVALLILWITGIYLFFFPRIKKRQKRQRLTTGPARTICINKE